MFFNIKKQTKIRIIFADDYYDAVNEKFFNHDYLDDEKYIYSTFTVAQDKSNEVILGEIYANDNNYSVGDTISIAHEDFEISGIYTTTQAIEQLRFFKTNNQISFHTERALDCLNYLETKEV